MHGRPRPPKGFVPPDEFIQKLEKKTKILKSATDEVLTRIQNESMDEATLSMSAKLIKLNPEIYTVWNYRRVTIQQLLDSEKINSDGQKELLLSELALVTEALMNNAKSYGSWHHRKWIISLDIVDVQPEFAFIEKRLEEDSRNFHAWNYRHFLVKKTGKSPEQELGFSQEKINQNFSNYSAWHHRSLCFMKVYEDVPVVAFTDLLTPKETHATLQSSPSYSIPVSILEQELQMVHSAFVTDPDDSSAWIYYRWLIGNILHLSRDKHDKIQLLLETEKKLFQSELLDLDPNSKWILLTYAMLLEVESEFQQNEKFDQILQIYDKLMEVDPMRKGFYTDLKNKTASIIVKI